MKLKILSEVPSELYNCGPRDVHSILGGPTLIHVKGESDDALFISTLLHGNETTSFYVFQKLINDFKVKRPQRDVIFLVGNTKAAAEGMRHLPDQPDFNRIWKEGPSDENHMSHDVLEYVKDINLFANIDIHNNTGNNPFYACINKIESEFLHLASLFSKRIVFFTTPKEVQAIAFKELCPSVTIEAGVSGVDEATFEVYNFVKRVLALDRFKTEMTPDEVSLFHTIARMVVSKDVEIDFEDKLSKEGISFVPTLDHFNFSPLIKGTLIGRTQNREHFKVIGDDGSDMTDIFFRFEAGGIIVNHIFIPSMFTKDVYVMKEDCLGYVMEKIISV